VVHALLVAVGRLVGRLGDDLRDARVLGHRRHRRRLARQELACSLRAAGLVDVSFSGSFIAFAKL